MAHIDRQVIHQSHSARHLPAAALEEVHVAVGVNAHQLRIDLAGDTVDVRQL